MYLFILCYTVNKWYYFEGGEMVEQDINRRVELLEQEVKDLKNELNQIKRANAASLRIQSTPKVETKEKPLTKYLI